MTLVPPLPVHGYTAQPQDKINLVNANKEGEELLLRGLDVLAQHTDTIDQRWLAIARSHFEQGFMALNRSVFQPQRFKFPGE
jgi:hypothetical protein